MLSLLLRMSDALPLLLRLDDAPDAAAAEPATGAFFATIGLTPAAPAAAEALPVPAGAAAAPPADLLGPRTAEQRRLLLLAWSVDTPAAPCADRGVIDLRTLAAGAAGAAAAACMLLVLPPSLGAETALLPPVLDLPPLLVAPAQDALLTLALRADRGWALLLLLHGPARTAAVGREAAGGAAAGAALLLLGNRVLGRDALALLLRWE